MMRHYKPRKRSGHASFIKSQESITNDIISNLCRFNNNNNNNDKKKKKKKKNHNNDTKTLEKNWMLKKISHTPQSVVFSRQYVNLIV